MTRKLTIGVTTFNESNHIAGLLVRFAEVDRNAFGFIFFDDASPDGTVASILNSEFYKTHNVHIEVAKKNSGGPAAGRQWIAANAETPFVTFIDGDDLVRMDKLEQVLPKLDDSVDMLITPYIFKGKTVGLNAPNGLVEICDKTVGRLISGIAGRIYRAEVAERCVCSDYIGRSEDARLNLNIIREGNKSIYYDSSACFYIIEQTRKSASARQINLTEFAERVRRYRKLAERYNLGADYIHAVRRNFLKTARSDLSLDLREREVLVSGINKILIPRVKRMVFLCADISRLGGVPTRMNKLISIGSSDGREYKMIGVENAGGWKLDAYSFFPADEEEIRDETERWKIYDTVVVTHNTVLTRMPQWFRSRVAKLPVIYFGAAQLSYLLKHNKKFLELSNKVSLRASAIVSLTNADINFQRQLGIFGQTQIDLFVPQRRKNTYLYSGKPVCGYVGVTDFKAKATDRLLDLALRLREHGLPPLKMFTTDARNSPDYEEFVRRAEDMGCKDMIDLQLNRSDKEEMYSAIDVLLVPSCQESFGNAILEAFSLGVPVFAASEAPGPSYLLADRDCGLLFDQFNAAEVVAALVNARPEEWKRMSNNAFAEHKKFTANRFVKQLDVLADKTLATFSGANTIQVFPQLALKEKITDGGRNQKRKEYLEAREALIVRLREKETVLKAKLEVSRKEEKASRALVRTRGVVITKRGEIIARQREAAELAQVKIDALKERLAEESPHCEQAGGDMNSFLLDLP